MNPECVTLSLEHYNDMQKKAALVDLFAMAAGNPATTFVSNTGVVNINLTKQSVEDAYRMMYTVNNAKTIVNINWQDK